MKTKQKREKKNIYLCELLLALKENRMDEFFKLLEQMQKLDFPVIADLPKFFSVLVEKKPIIALETFVQLKEKGHVSVKIYNILMDSLHKIGEVKKVLSLFDEMKGLSLKPDSFAYSIVILCLVELGEIKEACACHTKIIEMSCIPSVAAYSSLTKGLCKRCWFMIACAMLVMDQSSLSLVLPLFMHVNQMMPGRWLMH